MNKEKDADERALSELVEQLGLGPNESEYLKRQACVAREGVTHAVVDASKAAIRCMDPRLWTKQYPLAATFTAFIGGFIASEYATGHSGGRRRKKNHAAILDDQRNAGLKQNATSERKSNLMYKLIRVWAGHTLELWIIGWLAPKQRESQESKNRVLQQSKEMDVASDLQGESK